MTFGTRYYSTLFLITAMCLVAMFIVFSLAGREAKQQSASNTTPVETSAPVLDEVESIHQEVLTVDQVIHFVRGTRDDSRTSIQKDELWKEGTRFRASGIIQDVSGSEERISVSLCSSSDFCSPWELLTAWFDYEHLDRLRKLNKGEKVRVECSFRSSIVSVHAGDCQLLD